MGSVRGGQARPGNGGGSGTFAGRGRLDSIDLLRGLVMVVMALDHVRDYFSEGPFTNPPTDPVDLNRTTLALFLTRWVTHFCAPVFVFLAGTGAFLYGARGRTKLELSWFLLTRGVWLVFIELTLVHFGWNFHFDYTYACGGGVIWAIGWSMVVMAGLVFLPTSAVAVVGVALIGDHNLLDRLSAADVGLPEWLWVLLHQPGGFPVVYGINFGTGYCLLPWLGVMAAGYAFGAVFLLSRTERRQQLLGLGIALTLLFVALRYTNLYGDPPSYSPESPPRIMTNLPGPWTPQGDWVFSVLSFLNCQKYPPSLLYLLMTLGPAIAALALFDRPAGPVGRFFVTFGRVPLFYYLLHIPLIHGLAVGLDYLRFGRSPLASDVMWTVKPGTVPEGYGYGLPVVYLVWVGVVLALYPVCRWFAGIKRRHPGGWLSYL